jgi:hypothetical protein
MVGCFTWFFGSIQPAIPSHILSIHISPCPTSFRPLLSLSFSGFLYFRRGNQWFGVAQQQRIKVVWRRLCRGLTRRFFTGNKSLSGEPSKEEDLLSTWEKSSRSRSTANFCGSTSEALTYGYLDINLDYRVCWLQWPSHLSGLQHQALLGFEVSTSK